MNTLNDFPHPLDTPLQQETEIVVNAPSLDKSSGKVTIEQRKQKVIETVTYHKAEMRTLSCPKGEHKWVVKDDGKYIASCNNCMKNRFLNPVYMKVVNHQILSRDTNNLID